MRCDSGDCLLRMARRKGWGLAAEGQAMSEQEKPLHVKVAEALGWTLAFDSAYEHGWFARPPANSGFRFGEEDTPNSCYFIPRYDLDWSATGPLIEKYGIATARYQAGADWWASRWSRADIRDPIPPVKGIGPTPLIAVCNLLLALSAAGKLPKEGA
jgi:hypothetical protein